MFIANEIAAAMPRLLLKCGDDAYTRRHV